MTDKEQHLKDSGISLEEIASFDSDDYEETRAIASSFAERLNAGDTVLLTGELGSGKTAFTSGIADFFGVADDVRSPSFKIINKYKNKNQQRNTRRYFPKNSYCRYRNSF